MGKQSNTIVKEKSPKSITSKTGSETENEYSFRTNEGNCENLTVSTIEKNLKKECRQDSVTKCNSSSNASNYQSTNGRESISRDGCHPRFYHTW